jgi:hypothetical protein
MNDKVTRMWEEPAVAQCNLLLRNLEELRKITNNLSVFSVP